MKAKFLMAVLACLALFSSCDKQVVSHTGDDTGNLYGIWQLDKKTEVVPQSGGDQTREIDFSKIHFYLAISNAGVPHALAKKGSFTELDLKDVDVGGIQGLPEDLKKVLMDDQVHWERGLKELMGETQENPDAVRQNRLDKLGALKHPYRL